MSEFGCITNNRTFQSVSALYNSEMTSVFSGGLVYEYSEQSNGYGLVTINGNSVTDYNDQFNLLMEAYSKTPNPSGNGGASSTSSASTCPPSSDVWDVSNDALPDIPAAAVKYMKDGAGTGPGLNGPGSQNSGGTDTGSTGSTTGSAGAASLTGSYASTTNTGSSGVEKKSAATLQWQVAGRSIFLVGTTVVICTLAGIVLL